LAIKIILYRTDTDGRLIDALIQAAENKKQVACIIELKARFDEERNIQWAQKLEEAGIHVSYGLMELKTHAKMILVVRQDADRIRSYVNIGTGNYNSQTSRLYTDYGLFTCADEIGSEVLEVFNYLTGRSRKQDYKELLVAPYTMFKRFIELIENETKNAQAGKPARIVAKMNQLEEPQIIEALYKASQAGVKITLFIRGFCSLRPQMTGISENIQVFSLVGRLLEHSRIYFFQNAKKVPRQGLFYLGSADWMHRNLFDRVEVITPIKKNDLKQELWEYLSLLERDDRHLWELKSDGTYVQRRPSNEKKAINSQLLILKQN
ncbi:MAG: RNA degradosome polyphosphate kinase, partial [Halobacteriovoraceae bacterium]|nr:RNA degradosome polyphosphate kinase [Halobacteriovoraceae bacterium]